MSAAPSPTTLVTIRLPVTMKERLDWMAKVLQRPRNSVFLEALLRYLDQEEWQLEDILVALEEAESEEGVPHEEVMRGARAIIERARAEKAPDANSLDCAHRCLPPHGTRMADRCITAADMPSLPDVSTTLIEGPTDV